MSRSATAPTQPKPRYGQFYHMTDVIPEGATGDARVEHFTVDAQASAFTRLRQAANPGRDEYVPGGRYVRLYVGGELVMSDTDMELRSNLDAAIDAKGDVLIGGLGIGLVALAVAKKPNVRSVTVIEKSLDVVRLVEEPLRAQMTGNESAGFVVFVADVHTWAPDPRNIHRFDYVYLDIWSDICADDYDDHKRLRAKYRRMLRKGGKVDSWQFEHLQELTRGGRWR